MRQVLRLKRLLTAGVLAGLVVAMVVATVAQANHPGPPSGDGIQPSFAAGNPNCAVLDPGKVELRIDPPQDGTFTDGTLTVTIDVRDTAAGQVFDWTSNIGIDSIFVKGGSDGNFYRYDPPAEDTGDTGLHAPVNHSNNQFFGLSHISFCYDVNPEVSVVKTPDGGTVNAGATATFSITVTNDGPGASDVTLNDPLPDGGLNWSISAQPAGDPCQITGAVGSQVLSCNFGSVAEGATRTVAVSSPTDTPDCGTKNNTVTITASGDNTPGNNSDTGSITIQCPDVSVVKTPDAGTIAAGSNAVFSITVTNNGPGSAANVTLNDPLPDGGLNWSITSQPAGNPCQITGSVGSQVLSCDFGTLAQGATRTVEVTSPTLAGSGSCGVKNNTATVTASGDTNSGNNSDAGQITISCPDISVTKQGNGTVDVGGVAEFTMVITNNGPGTATGISLTDDLPGSGWTIFSQTGSACTTADSGGTLSCSGITLAESATYTVVVRKTTTAADCGALENTVTVSATNEGTNQANNTASATVTVNCADVEIEKTPDNGTVALGGSIEFTIVVRNNGPSSATNVTLTDTLPAGFTWQLGGADAAACQPFTSPNLSCNFGTLADDEERTVTLTATTDVEDCGVVTNTANVSSTVDTNAGNNSDSGSVTVQCATIVVVKQTVPDGSSNEFEFTGDLAGSLADGESESKVVAPGQYSVQESSEAGWNLTAIECSDPTQNSSGSLAAATATYNVAAGETATCTFTNTQVTVVLGQGAIDVQKSADPTSVKEPGGPVTFSVTITNVSNVNVTITNVVDSVFGDLDDTDGAGVFDVPLNLAPGQSQTQTFQRQVTGSAGQAHINVVTASGTDQHGNPVSDSDDARVEITPRLIDLAIVKNATSPTPLNGTVTYTMTVTNKGPDTATNVQLADPAPAAITYLTVNTSQGTCNLTTSLITCSLGTIAPGQTVTITVTARATAVGTHTNTATVTGSGGRETNPADNVDDAVTVVPAPFVPPAAPKPEVKPVCLTLTVSPKMIRADGKPDRVSVKVTAAKKRMKGVKVAVLGAGVRKTSRSNAKGMAHLVINPKRAGLITITALETNQRVCGAKRIGVVGVFLPPLTG